MTSLISLKKACRRVILTCLGAYLLFLAGFSFESVRVNAIVSLTLEGTLLLCAALHVVWLKSGYKIFGIMGFLALLIVFLFVPFNPLDLLLTVVNNHETGRRLESVQINKDFRLCHYYCFESGKTRGVNRMVAEYDILPGIKFSREIGSSWE
jgi:hypothetical protein